MRIGFLKDFQVQTLNFKSSRSYLHEGGQVGVVVVQRGDDVELDLDQDTLAQVILCSDVCQSMEQLNLGSSVRGRKREGIRSEKCMCKIIFSALINVTFSTLAHCNLVLLRFPHKITNM